MITEHLRHPSSRPQLVVDSRGRAIGDGGQLGRPGPLGRERVVSALPTSMVELKFASAVVDQRARLLADPLAAVIAPVPGEAVIVHRMLWAGKAEDTRRL